MAAKTKQPKPTRYYVFSELMDSCNIPSDMKDILEREKSTYRRTVPSQMMSPSDKQKVHEIVTSHRKLHLIDNEGEKREVEVELCSYDVKSWRYYFEPKTLKDLETFMEDLGLEIGFQTYDPNNPDHEGLEAYLEEKMGIPLPEVPIVTMNILDSVLMDNDCECEDCRQSREEEENDDE